jgi:nucleotide-binding universal stress UspA family protein
MTADTPLTRRLDLVVGYDGSPPASRALDAAVELLRGRNGGIDVVYVSHLSSFDTMSAGAIAEMESSFDEIEQDLRASAAAQLGDCGVAWNFQRHQGIIARELVAVASDIRDAHPE